MEIDVEFFAYLIDFSPTGQKKISLTVEEGVTLQNLLAKFGIPHNVEKICLVNGTFYPEEKTLQQGDTVRIYPMLSGG